MKSTTSVTHPRHFSGIFRFALMIFAVAFICEGCKNDDENSCQENNCYGMERACVEVIPFEREPSVCEQIVISYIVKDSTFIETNCGHYDNAEWGRLNPVSCFDGVGSEFTLTVNQNDHNYASIEIPAAEFNYCGRDIAYVYVMLHEDGPPTFSEIFYVSPCETSSL